MTARLVVTADFDADVARQTTYLVQLGRPDWAARLFDEILRTADTLVEHLELGVLEVASRGIRKIVLARVPLILRYAWEPRTRRVVLLRLFHARQRRR